MTEKMIRDAYCRIRTIDQTIPDEVLDFMKDAAIEKLGKHDVIGRSEQLVNFLLHLNDKELINNYDFDYEKEAKKYLKKNS